MSFVGSKTPVSLVNEYYINRGITPKFTVVPEKTQNAKAHNPTFTIHLEAGDDYSEGTGASKQQAKHKAAEALLEVLKGRNAFGYELRHVIETVANPNENRISKNAVGDLQDFVESKNWPNPVYDQIHEEGPSHAKIFTFQCTVSYRKEYGTSGTKKQAKHQAAAAMLTHLKKLSGEETMALARISVPEVVDVSNKGDDEAVQLYLKIAAKKPHSIRDSTSIGSQYLAYYKLTEKSLTLGTLNTDNELLETPQETLRTIARDLKTAPEYFEHRSEIDPSLVIVFVELKLSPLLCGAGRTRDEAAACALESLQTLTG